MGRTATHKSIPRRLRSGLNALIHSLVFFFASVAALALFYVLLILIESAWYAITGDAVSVWALALSAFAASLLFSPIVHGLQRTIDRLLYRKRIDLPTAVKQLDTAELTSLPAGQLEYHFLERLSDIFQRQPLLLEEDGQCFIYPASASPDDDFELSLPMEYQHMSATLHLGFRHDGWMADAQEQTTLASVIRIAGIVLEHARLTGKQVEAARLDSLTRVTAQLHSHDLKNRLNDLAFLAHHLHAGDLDAEEIPRLTQSITRVVRRMQSVMQRMADPQAPLSPRLQPASLDVLLRHQIETQLWPESVQVHSQLTPGVMAVVDEAMLQAVFNNLFDNAIQAMERQGNIWLTLRRCGEKAEITVRDDGCGMSAEFIERRLFRLFSSSKSNGLGVGLYLSHRMIEAQHGELCATSEGKGKGSTFIIRLPLWQHAGQSDV